jgi:predicted DNA-binding transcriptional regulator AlpA
MDFLQPRLIRLRDAAQYLGMDKNRFNAEVRPYLTEIPIGTQGVGFDRLDLDQWFEQYKARNGRPGRAMEGGNAWGKKSHQDSLSAGGSGTSRSKSELVEFEKALAQAALRKRKDT